jgi:hypothetical protein
MIPFDCWEYPGDSSTTDFNTLWAKTDDSTNNGGLPFAVVLASGNGKPITGFYGKDGKRCDQFSEFLAPLSGIQAYSVNPVMRAGQQQTITTAGGLVPTGAPFPVPTTGSAMVQLRQGLTVGHSPQIRYPVTPDEFRACPILVRALVVPHYTSSPEVASDFYSGTGTANAFTLADGSHHCIRAKSLEFRIRVEQLVHIAGETPLKTFETGGPSEHSALRVDVEKMIQTRQ